MIKHWTVQIGSLSKNWGEFGWSQSPWQRVLFLAAATELVPLASSPRQQWLRITCVHRERNIFYLNQAKKKRFTQDFRECEIIQSDGLWAIKPVWHSYPWDCVFVLRNIKTVIKMKLPAGPKSGVKHCSGSATLVQTCKSHAYWNYIINCRFCASLMLNLRNTVFKNWVNNEKNNIYSLIHSIMLPINYLRALFHLNHGYDNTAMLSPSGGQYGCVYQTVASH